MALQEDCALAKINLTKAEKALNKKECGELEGLFKALHRTFEETSDKQRNLSSEMAKCKKVCDEHLGTAKQDDARLKSALAGERRNLEQLMQIDRESSQQHEMMLEQIKFCSDQVSYSKEQTSSRIESIRTEIQRLQDLEKQETDRLQHLTACSVQIQKVEEEERKREEKTRAERAGAKKNAAERVTRAQKGVKSSEEFVERLQTLYKDVELEFDDALKYGTEVLKAIGVDCHTAFLEHGKYLAIEREIAKTNRADFDRTREEKQLRQIETDRLEDEEVQATVERAEQARRELEKAEEDVHECDKRIEDNKKKREALLHDYEEVNTFLRKHASSSSSDKLVVVKTLPMARDHLAVDMARVDCSSVAEFRDQRGDATAMGHTLATLQDFEADFARRYKGETAGNVTSLFTALNNKFRGMIGQ